VFPALAKLDAAASFSVVKYPCTSVLLLLIDCPRVPDWDGGVVKSEVVEEVATGAADDVEG